MRSAETRERVLDATVECLVELGYAGTTTPVVCERAGLSRGALLHHFPTKHELVTSAIAHLAKRRGEELRADVKAIGGKPTTPALLDMVRTSFTGPLFYASLELWVAARTDPELYEHLVRFERALGSEIRKSWLELGAPSEAQRQQFNDVVELTMYMMRGMALQKILRDDDTERRRLFERWKAMALSVLQETNAD
jgi:AcrR family transcriptional regulator